MKREQVIELIGKHGCMWREDNFVQGAEFELSQLSALITEVEQATLEQAAKLLDAEFNKSLQGAYAASAEIVRNLAKESK